MYSKADGSPVSLEALQQNRITDDVYGIFRNHIVNRTFAPGQRLQVNELALQLGVSRTPVKDALNRLATEGLIKISPRRGTFVTDLTVEEIIETYEVRQALELAAAERLIQSVTPAQLQELEQALREVEELKVSGEEDDGLVEEHLRSNFDFHELLVRLSGNRKLLDAYRGLNAAIQIARVHYRAPKWQQRLSQEKREHRAILKALQQRDSVALAEAIKMHLHRARQSLVADMEAWAASKTTGAG